MSKFAIGDVVQVVNQASEHRGKIGPVEKICVCVVVIMARQQMYTVGGIGCFMESSLKKIDEDGDPNQIVDWDQVPGGKPKVREIA